MWETHRNPLLSFELFGLFLLRYAHRASRSACPRTKGVHKRADRPYAPNAFLRQPPSSRPISATISDT